MALATATGRADGAPPMDPDEPSTEPEEPPSSCELEAGCIPGALTEWDVL